eukprot:scaffold71_cov247-Pinguiococcus_pyrenoidosus.AAC.41
MCCEVRCVSAPLFPRNSWRSRVKDDSPEEEEATASSGGGSCGYSRRGAFILAPFELSKHLSITLCSVFQTSNDNASAQPEAEQKSTEDGEGDEGPGMKLLGIGGRRCAKPYEFRVDLFEKHRRSLQKC